MNVLIVGSGGREHALGWKLAQSPRAGNLFFAPGNAGTVALGSSIPLKEPAQIVAWSRENAVDLVVIGPEAPLVDGLADHLMQADIPCFGPCAAAARLEGSKAFAKETMVKAGVPTARFEVFDDFSAAVREVERRRGRCVVKADGLAAGKGVTVCQDTGQAIVALEAAMQEKVFGSAGEVVVIEDLLEGVEASFHVLCDGHHVHPLPTSQDHKAIFEGNRGPNTGGMGTFAPNPNITPDLAQTLIRQFAKPTLTTLEKQGIQYRGVLYIGLMLTSSGPQVLEFNVRFGDPETQVMLPLLDHDLLDLMSHVATAQPIPLNSMRMLPKCAVCVVLAAHGYPGSPRKGDPISGLDADVGPEAHMFHAGTGLDENGRPITSGGRVLGVTAWAETRESARSKAYQMAEAIQFQGKTYRKDIGVTP